MPFYMTNTEYYTNLSYNSTSVNVTDNTAFTSQYLDFQTQGVKSSDTLFIQYLAIANITANFIMPTYTISGGSAFQANATT